MSNYTPANATMEDNKNLNYQFFIRSYLKDLSPLIPLAIYNFLTFECKYRNIFHLSISATISAAMQNCEINSQFSIFHAAFI